MWEVRTIEDSANASIMDEEGSVTVAVASADRMNVEQQDAAAVAGEQRSAAPRSRSPSPATLVNDDAEEEVSCPIPFVLRVDTCAPLLQRMDMELEPHDRVLDPSASFNEYNFWRLGMSV